jgi:serine/threonine protein kinase
LRWNFKRAEQSTEEVWPPFLPLSLGGSRDRKKKEKRASSTCSTAHLVTAARRSIRPIGTDIGDSKFPSCCTMPCRSRLSPIRNIISRPKDNSRFHASTRQLGAGSFGVVFAGVDICTSHKVAIKLIRPDARMSGAELEREVSILQRLAKGGHATHLAFHGHFAPQEVKAGAVAVGAGIRLPIRREQTGKEVRGKRQRVRLDECHALVMEHGGDSTLYDTVCNADYPAYEHGMSEEDVGPLFAQMVEAVRAAHLLGIVHGDIKLEHFAGRDGEDIYHVRLKLIDWGQAYMFPRNEDGRVVVTRLRTKGGTRQYLAPERTEWAGATRSTSGYDGFAADVWSLGVCLFTMLLRRPPFAQSNPDVDERAKRVLIAERLGGKLGAISALACVEAERGANPNFTSRLLKLSEPVRSILDRMLLFDPMRRATIDDVLSSAWVSPHVDAVRKGCSERSTGSSTCMSAEDFHTSSDDHGDDSIELVAEVEGARVGAAPTCAWNDASCSSQGRFVEWHALCC